MTRVLPSDQSEALQQKKMRAVYEGTAPEDAEILSRMATARIRSARASTRGSRRVGPVVIGVIAALFSCGTAFAWGVHTGVVRVPFLESIVEPREQNLEESAEKKSRALGTTETSAIRTTPRKEPTKTLDEKTLDSTANGAEPVRPDTREKSLLTEAPVRTSDQSLSTKTTPAFEPVQLAEERGDDLRGSSWREVTQSLNDGKLDKARAATKELEKSDDRATREAAQLLSIQLHLRQQGSSPTPTDEQRRQLRVLANGAISASVRQASAKLLGTSSP